MHKINMSTLDRCYFFKSENCLHYFSLTTINYIFTKRDTFQFVRFRFAKGAQLYLLKHLVNVFQ